MAFCCHKLAWTDDHSANTAVGGFIGSMCIWSIIQRCMSDAIYGYVHTYSFSNRFLVVQFYRLIQFAGEMDISKFQMDHSVTSLLHFIVFTVAWTVWSTIFEISFTHWSYDLFNDCLHWPDRAVINIGFCCCSCSDVVRFDHWTSRDRFLELLVSRKVHQRSRISLVRLWARCTLMLSSVD